MSLRRLLSFGGLCGACVLAQTTPTVGSGAPSPEITQAFVEAYQRHGFNLLVGSPLENVASYGSGGLIQRFPGATDHALTLALIKPDTTTAHNVRQVLAAMYAFYVTVTVSTAGFPTDDTNECDLPAPGDADNSCLWQPFSNNYALFVYALGVHGRTNSVLRNSFYAKWSASGGISVFGPALSNESPAYSPYYSGATKQTFDQGAIYSGTAYTLAGQLLAVKQPVYGLYLSNRAELGMLGFPVTDERVLENGIIQQAFERGAIEYDPASHTPRLRPPVASLALSPGGPIETHVGASLQAQVLLYSDDGAPIADRPVTWQSSNGKVLQIQGSGMAVTLKGGDIGAADVTVRAEGKVSPPLHISVKAVPCCQIGEGAPTESIRQAFLGAVARNRLSVQLPAASGVVRVASGYVQQLASTGDPSVPYLIAVPDSTGAGCLVSGAVLTRYLELGGPSGTLGYPLSDATAGGRQTFQHGVLAGNPLQLVTGAILSKWAALGYETGAIGSPGSPAAAFLTFRGTAGNMQSFQAGLIVAPTTGSLSGQAFLVAGQILAKYSSSGGPGGDLGAPASDERLVSGLRRQDFEGGYIDYAPGDSEATLHGRPRQPLVIATPGSVLAGSSVHLVVGGFDNGASVRVSQTGQSDFIVTMPNGTYAWDVWIPASAPAGTATVRASTGNGSTSAQTTYAVYLPSSVSPVVSIVSGDRQDGAPGALLVQPLVVVVQDQYGNPLPGQSVTFAASPGAQVIPESAVSGPDGRASAVLRLPMAEGITLATAKAGRQVVTFSARGAALSLMNFPALTQAVDGTLGNGSDTIADKGALLTAAASVVRYHQSRNELPQPNGLADPASLNTFLRSFCVPDSQGNQICDGFVALPHSTEQTVNLWRVGAFVGNNLDVRVEPPSVDAVRDMVAAGSPVLLALSVGGLGSHFVVATGIAADGSLLIADPNPAFGRTNLNSYLNGFDFQAQTLRGTLMGMVRLLPRAPSLPGFVVATNAPVAVSSAAGACGQTLGFPDTAAVAGATPASLPGMVYFRPCEGSAGLYQLDIGGEDSYDLTFTDLAQNGGRTVLAGSRATSYGIALNAGRWSIGPLVTLIAGGVVNAASFTDQIAPGGLISIYGAGFVRAGSDTTVQINSEAASVVAALPFQVYAQIPFRVPPVAAELTVSSANGSAQQSIVVLKVAPAIFSLTPGHAAILNQDKTINGPSNPAKRGATIVVYATGFGAVSATNVAVTGVSAVIGGVEIPASFAGLAPGVTGLYQANIVLPSTLAPGLSLPLYLKQQDAVSNVVTVAVQ